MAEILLNFPDHFETERLIIRSPLSGDGKIVYEAVIESLAELRKWPASLPWSLEEPSLDSSEAYCRICHSAFLARKDLPMLIFQKSDNALVGATGLHRINWDIPKFEVGYWGRTRFCKKGLITEAVKGITEFAFTYLNANRLECFPDSENWPSRLVAERAGYHLEGIMLNERREPNGNLRNTCIYAITR
ncbi:GNAT family N-acetyltransferase [Chromobacterium sp. CV08]|uniref:GNAT family N-acetyltransferase n=1 Tax=Chromobacterium sp. CV08 TaxID=3133274 RepID=UPI003DA88ED5